jgi:hypothetical protein
LSDGKIRASAELRDQLLKLTNPSLHVHAVKTLIKTSWEIWIIRSCQLEHAFSFADMHPSVPNCWEGDGIRQRLYSRFTDVTGRKVTFSLIIFLLDLIVFLVLLFGFE